MPADDKNKNTQPTYGLQKIGDPDRPHSSVELYTITNSDKQLIDRVSKANQERVNAYKNYPPGDALDAQLETIDQRMQESLARKVKTSTAGEIAKDVSKGIIGITGDLALNLMSGGMAGTPVSDLMSATESDSERKSYPPTPEMFRTAFQNGKHQVAPRSSAEFHTQTLSPAQSPQVSKSQSITNSRSGEKVKEKLATFSVTEERVGTNVYLYGVNEGPKFVVELAKKANEARINAYKNNPPGEALEAELKAIEKQFHKDIGNKQIKLSVKEGAANTALMAGSVLSFLATFEPGAGGVSPNLSYDSSSLNDVETHQPAFEMFEEAHSNGLHGKPIKPNQQSLSGKSSQSPSSSISQAQPDRISSEYVRSDVVTISPVLKGAGVTLQAVGTNVSLYKMEKGPLFAAELAHKANEARTAAYKEHAPGPALNQKLGEIDKKFIEDLESQTKKYARKDGAINSVLKTSSFVTDFFVLSESSFPPQTDWFGKYESHQTTPTKYEPPSKMYEEAHSAGYHGTPVTVATQSPELLDSSAINNDNSNNTDLKTDNDIKFNFWHRQLEDIGYQPKVNTKPDGSIDSIEFRSKDAKPNDPPSAVVKKDSIAISKDAGPEVYDHVMKTAAESGAESIFIPGDPPPHVAQKIAQAAAKHGLKVEFESPSLQSAWENQQAANAKQVTSFTVAPEKGNEQAVHEEASLETHSEPQQKPYLAVSGKGLIKWLDNNKDYQKDQEGNYRLTKNPDQVVFSAKKSEEGLDHIEMPEKNKHGIKGLMEMAPASEGGVTVTGGADRAEYIALKYAAISGAPVKVKDFNPSGEDLQKIAAELIRLHKPPTEDKVSLKSPVDAIKDGEIIPEKSEILCRLNGHGGDALVVMPKENIVADSIDKTNKETWKVVKVSEEQLKKWELHNAQKGQSIKEPLVAGHNLEESQKIVQERKAQNASLSRANSTSNSSSRLR